MPGVTGGVPRVRDFRDPVALGVRPAWDPGGAPAAPPPYVRRDSHDEVASAVRQSGLVVVEGPSLVGKSRLAFEVMLQSLPDHRLVVPADPAALRELCAGAGTLEAQRHLLTVERLAPQRIRSYTTARYLLDRAEHGSPLRGLCERMGVAS
jgi:hypothetical protein